MLFDSHAHINEESLSDGEREEFVEKIIEDPKLGYVMDMGFNYNSSYMAVEHAKEYDWCYAAVGVHPSDTNTMNDEVLEAIKKLATENPKAVAIGEIGLDYHYDDSDRELQQYWFRKQLQLAKELKLPICIHSRDADLATMNILKQEGIFTDERKADFPRRTGAAGKEEGDARLLLHCFSGSSELAKEYVKLGATISIAGPVTYKNNKKTIKVVEEIPMEYLLIETDSPYLSPEPLRGKKNNPVNVIHTAEKVADIKGISLEEVEKVTCSNAKNFYGIE